jgi:Zn-finger nucleic acid-binding protein
MQVVNIDRDLGLHLHETTGTHHRPKEQIVFGDRGEVDSSLLKEDDSPRLKGSVDIHFGRISASSLNDAKVQYQKKKKKRKSHLLRIHKHPRRVTPEKQSLNVTT